MNSPNPLRVWLVRHGITDWNIEGRWQGWSDTPLSSLGIAQAQRVKSRLEGKPFTAVYSSDLERALRTAQLAGFEPVPDSRLREVHFGAFEGGTSVENAQHPAFEAWLEQSSTARTPEGESYVDLQHRMHAWLETLPDEGDVLAFTHGGAIQTLVTSLLRIPALAAPRLWTLRVTHASLTVLERWWTPSGPAWTLERLNDTAHLEGDEVLPVHTSL
jgi:broad specificity phosphatase PhoE